MSSGSARARSVIVSLFVYASGCASTVGSTQGTADATADATATADASDAGPPPIVDLAGAGPNTCALRSDGRVRCWGQYGRMGDPTAPPVGTIAEVAGLTDARRIAVQPDVPARGCAVREGGAVVCWSTNAAGAVGRPIATPRPLPSAAIDVAMGAEHACALTVDRRVLCWGDNTAGQLGVGDYAPRADAAPVAGLSGVAELAAWESNTCARTADGAVYCWGRNFLGALGDGVARHDCPNHEGSEDCSATPVRVTGIGPAEAVSVGLNSACALVRGVPYCWGWITERREGDGGVPQVWTATRVGDLADVTSVFAGYLTGAVIGRGGEVTTWGADFSTETDAGTITDQRPRSVAGVRGVRRVVGGWYHLCALQRAGEVLCWGNGGFGQFARAGAGHSGPVLIEGL